MRKTVIVAGIVAGLTTVLGASAQESNGQASGQANVGMSLPGATPATAAAGASDHERVVGRLAVGYLGRATVGAGAFAAPGAAVSPEGYAVVGAAPVIGVRYWVNSLLGIDAGLGLGIVGGSFETTDPDTDGDLDSFTGFVFHAGVPLALASADHFTFEIIPEANIGIGSAEQTVGGDTLDHNGFHFDIGARAGAEIHFGFINIPQLSLQGSVGLLFALDNASTDIEDGAPASVSGSRTALQTTVGANPWNIFTSNVAALYYF